MSVTYLPNNPRVVRLTKELRESARIERHKAVTRLIGDAGYEAAQFNADLALAVSLQTTLDRTALASMREHLSAALAQIDAASAILAREPS